LLPGVIPNDDVLGQLLTSRVAVVSVHVSDQERAKGFYVDSLGLELVRDDSSIPAAAGLTAELS
jgi:catechol 2,3-dioxygenase-like lactoylglutathione lyase family enzyme